MIENVTDQKFCRYCKHFDVIRYYLTGSCKITNQEGIFYKRKACEYFELRVLKAKEREDEYLYKNYKGD